MAIVPARTRTYPLGHPAQPGNVPVAAICAPYGRRETPMAGPAQRIAEVEPSVSIMPFLEQTCLAGHTGRTKSEERTGRHVLQDAGEPKARASTELPEA